ncbi:MAG: phytanoyl-CoA dioxygenase family protein [Opitutaceae bacterium]|nr:phytanoyl-CoA dioxygenase family protein [Opitutaceae bacterium]
MNTHFENLLRPFEELPGEIARSLSEEGFVVLPNMADSETLLALRTALDDLVSSEGKDAALEHHQETGAHRIANLVNKGRIFEDAWSHPLILACCAHMFGRPFKLSSCNGREALPGGGHQPLHSDWKYERGPIDSAHSCNALWAVDDLTAENGAPRLVPKSNRISGRPEEFIDDPDAAHPQEIVAEVPAGSVIMINAHTWHGGTTNRSGERRRVLHAYYTAREHKQQQDQQRWVTDETRTWMSTEQRWLLDVD